MHTFLNKLILTLILLFSIEAPFAAQAKGVSQINWTIFYLERSAAYHLFIATDINNEDWSKWSPEKRHFMKGLRNMCLCIALDTENTLAEIARLMGNPEQEGNYRRQAGSIRCSNSYK